MAGINKVTVPSLAGLTESDAEASLKKSGLVLGAKSLVSSPTLVAGRVSSSDPASGTAVDPGSTVDLQISSGPAQPGASGAIKVPTVVGLPKADAEKMLQQLGLKFAETAAPHPTIPAGSVSNVNPTPGTAVSPGSTVTLEISNGPAQAVAPAPIVQPPTPAKQIAIPDVIGLTRSAAETILKNAGLGVGAVRTHHSNRFPDGGICSTNPDAGMLVNPSTAVALDISNGPEPNWTQYLQPVLFSALGLIILGFIGFIITDYGQSFLGSLADSNKARGLITFLIAITTVGIAIILAISTLVLTEGDAGDRRFDRGKQVLSVMIGVLGTIVGFYFGAETKATQPGTPGPAQTLTITSTALPDATVGKPYTAPLQFSGGVAPVTWKVDPALPAELHLDPGGTITGTPSQAKAKSSFKFTVTDSASPPVSKSKDVSFEVKQ
jgi:beta-lactam-binding protein with PASTA domain